MMMKKHADTKRAPERGAVKIVRCPYCGAEYEEGLLHCPYCGAVDDHQDETAFLEDLDELKDKLEDLPEEAVRETNRIQTREAVRDLGRIFRRVGIAAGIIFLLFAAFFIYDRGIAGNTPARQKEESRKKYLWMRENIPLLDGMYEKGDYEGLLEAYSREDENWFYEWEHYDLLRGLYLLQRIRERDIPLAEETEKVYGASARQTVEDRSVLLADELQILYFDRQAENKEDIGTIRGMSEDVLYDLETRFSLSEEEKAHFEKIADEHYGYITISECKQFLEKR